MVCNTYSKKCLRCGKCLSFCPVYKILRDERVSPRAKAHIPAALAGEAGRGEHDARSLFKVCLQCGRCARGCAAGIRLDKIIHDMRQGCSYSWRTKLVAKALSLAGAGPLVMQAASRAGMVPRIAPLRQEREHIASDHKDNGIVYFPGCAQAGPLAGVAEHIVSLFSGRIVQLEKVGCCGLPAWSAGLEQEAREAAWTVLSILERLEFHILLISCASCAHMISNVWPTLFPAGDSRHRLAVQVSDRCREFSELLLEGGIDVGLDSKAGSRIAVHVPCHQQSIGRLDAAARLIESVGPATGEIVDACCGHGGLFSLTNPEVSGRIGQKCLAGLKRTGAGVVVTSCSGCLMRLKELEERHGGPRALHVAQLFAVS